LDVLVTGWPTIADLRYGRREGYISAAEVIELEAKRLLTDRIVRPVSEEIALLLPDDMDRVDSLLDSALKSGSADDAESARFWRLVLVASAVAVHSDDVDEFREALMDILQKFGNDPALFPLISGSDWLTQSRAFVASEAEWAASRTQ
jgi:hypothetical protein